MSQFAAQCAVLALPFLGTLLGAAAVYLLPQGISGGRQRLLLGFAAGIMLAACVWSLLIPAMELEAKRGGTPWLPAAGGFLLGIAFLLLLDSVIPHLHLDAREPEGPRSKLPSSAKLMLAVTLHNIPEGMAVGVVLAGGLLEGTGLTLTAALTLSLGIAIQNIPEGAVISLPLTQEGYTQKKAFGLGILSGAVEPLGALLAFCLTGLILPLLPFVLSFAAGAMFYVVVEDLIPQAQAEPHSNLGTIGASLGFVLMMALDTVLG